MQLLMRKQTLFALSTMRTWRESGLRPCMTTAQPPSRYARWPEAVKTRRRFGRDVWGVLRRCLAAHHSDTTIRMSALDERPAITIRRYAFPAPRAPAP